MASEPTVVERSQGQTTAAGGSIEPSAVLPLTAFLDELVREQVRLTGADAGLIWLAATSVRKAGVVASFASPELAQRARAWHGAVAARVERLLPRFLGDEGVLASESVIEPLRMEERDSVYHTEATHMLLAVPLVAEGGLEGICAMLLPRAGGVAPGEAAVRARLAASRFEGFLWRENALREGEQRLRLRETLQLLDVGLQGQSASTMGSLLCHELRRRFGCTRVSIGLVKGDVIRLVAVSGADEVDRRAPATDPLEAAMEECAAQDVEIVYPPPMELEQDPGGRRVVRAHEQLSLKAGPAAIVSLPLRVEGDLVGVITLERAPDDPFPLGAAALLRLIAEFIGPAVWTRRLADRGVAAVARDRVLDIGAAIVGPRHTGWKIVGTLLLLAFLGLAFIPIPDRVGASAEIRAVTSRTMPPPFTGYLAEVFVRPGDRVTAGQVIARMETSELALQLEENLGKRATLETERDNAHTTGDLGAWRRADRGIAEVDAHISLLRSYLDRAEIRAPMDGVVSRGELDEFLGARVEPTTALFEIITTERLALLEVDERDIRRVRPEQAGHLVVNALPGKRVPVRVERINPSAEAVQGGNVFFVEAAIDGEGPALAPGTRGRVKLRDGWTTGLAALCRPVIDEIRLRLWW